MPLGNPITIENESRTLTVSVTSAGVDTYNIADGYKINHINVYRNGVKLGVGEDFVASDGSTVTFVTAPDVGDVIEFGIFDEFQVNDAIVGAASSQTIYGDLTINGRLYTNNDVIVGGAAYADVAGIATYATSAGFSTVAGIASALSIDAVVTTTGSITAQSLTGVSSVTTANLFADSAVISGIVTAVGFASANASAADFPYGVTLTEFSEGLQSLGNTGSAATINLANGTFVTATLTDNCTFTFTPGITAGSIGFSLLLENDTSGPHSIVWPTSVKWPANTTPSRTETDSKKDLWVFVSYDGGTSWYGNIAIYNFNA